MYVSEHDDAHWLAETEALGDKIEDEEKLWQQQGFHYNMVGIDPYLVSIKIKTLVTLVMRMGVSEAEMEAQFKAEVLAKLKEDRAGLIDAKMKAQRPDIAVAQTRILGPGGQPIV